MSEKRPNIYMYIGIAAPSNQTAKKKLSQNNRKTNKSTCDLAMHIVQHFSLGVLFPLRAVCLWETPPTHTHTHFLALPSCRMSNVTWSTDTDTDDGSMRRRPEGTEGILPIVLFCFYSQRLVVVSMSGALFFSYLYLYLFFLLLLVNLAPSSYTGRDKAYLFGGGGIPGPHRRVWGVATALLLLRDGSSQCWYALRL
eukprot:gene1653-1021_t